MRCSGIDTTSSPRISLSISMIVHFLWHEPVATGKSVSNVSSERGRKYWVVGGSGNSNNLFWSQSIEQRQPRVRRVSENFNDVQKRRQENFPHINCARDAGRLRRITRQNGPRRRGCRVVPATTTEMAPPAHYHARHALQILRFGGQVRVVCCVLHCGARASAVVASSAFPGARVIVC